jgi:hypothetical protein
MIMLARRLAVVFSSLVTPALALAQSTSTDSMPGAGSWAAEVALGPGVSGANLLRFQSRRVALLLGGEFRVIHVDNDDNTSSFILSSGTQTNFGARLGIRTYRESSSERLRPIVGVGARTEYSKGPSSARSWEAGGYAELGATYFLTPHFSLGGTGELQASLGKRKQTIGSQTIDQNTTTFGGSLIRVLMSVYF